MLTLWAENNLDAILMPPSITIAYKHGYFKDLTFIAETAFANVMNLPAGVVPVTVVKENEQEYSKETSGIHWDLISKKLEENMKESITLTQRHYMFQNLKKYCRYLIITFS